MKVKKSLRIFHIFGYKQDMKVKKEFKIPSQFWLQKGYENLKKV
jgi:hypothetical protein